jgi:cytochrome P450
VKRDVTFEHSAAETDATNHFSNHHQSVERAYDLYAQMHDRCPVAHSNEHGGFFIIARYDDVRRAAVDPATFSSAQGVYVPQPDAPKVPMLEMDEPGHGVWRRLFKKGINPTTVRQVRSRVEHYVAGRITELLDRAECDLVAEIAQPLPVWTICQMIGLEDEKVDRALSVAMGLYRSLGRPDRMVKALRDYEEFVGGEFEQRRRHPGRDDYLTWLSTVEVNGAPLPIDQLTAFSRNLFIAGHHTTTSALASMMLHMLSKQDLVQRFGDRIDFVESFSQETLRLNSPSHGFARTVNSDTTVADVDIPAASRVFLGYAAANRDPQVFARPDEFDPMRQARPHLAFGHGPHTCPGAPLPRMEMAIVFEQLRHHVHRMRLKGGTGSYAFAGGNLARIESLEVEILREAAADPTRYAPHP